MRRVRPRHLTLGLDLVDFSEFRFDNSPALPFPYSLHTLS